MKGVIIIPARLQSSRLPGKLLLDRTGKPLIQHVYDNCVQAVDKSDGLLVGPFVACDREEKELIEALPHPQFVIPTSGTHPNGTSRCVEAINWLESLNPCYDFVINVQADEPELKPEAIKKLTAAMCENRDMATLVTDETVDSWRFDDPSTVKVVMDERMRALYFSRYPIGRNDYNHDFHRHIGCYGYKREVLARLTYPAIYEDLEQTTALYFGIPIQCAWVPPDQAGYAINTPDDYYFFVTRYLKEHPECLSHA